jgi:predicted nuclease with TOPRIM domain
MEKLTLKLSTLMKDEREAAKLDYQELKKTKNAALAKSASQYEETTDQIRSVRSDLIFAQDELNRLEDASRRNRLRVIELEDERSSFRKQAGRTMAIAIGRITRSSHKSESGFYNQERAHKLRLRNMHRGSPPDH